MPKLDFVITRYQDMGLDLLKRMFSMERGNSLVSIRVFRWLCGGNG